MTQGGSVQRRVVYSDLCVGKTHRTLVFQTWWQPQLLPVLVFWGCYDRIPETRWLTNNRNLFLIVLETGKFKIEV